MQCSPEAALPSPYADVSLFKIPAAFGKLPKPKVLERMEVARQILKGVLTARAPWLLCGPRGNGKKLLGSDAFGGADSTKRRFISMDVPDEELQAHDSVAAASVG